MGPLLGNAAVLDHQDAVGGPDGGEPVGDDQGGAAPAQLVEGMLDPGFRDAVQGGGGLVQNEDGRIFQKNPGNGYPLLLAPGQQGAPLAHIGVEPVGHGGNIVVQLRPASSTSASEASGLP